MQFKKDIYTLRVRINEEIRFLNEIFYWKEGFNLLKL